MLARDALGEWPRGRMDFDVAEDSGDEESEYTADGRLLTNIVMMGMGEPLYNFEHVRDALKLVMDGDGLALSKRRITLSTSGVIPMMERCGEEIGVNLAVSLHGVLYANGLSWTAPAATVRGALISEGSAAGDASLDLSRDAAVLDTLRTRDGSFVRLPGSWRDF
jgi:hypothetical protein